MDVFLCKRWLSCRKLHLKQAGLTSIYLNLQTNWNCQTALFTWMSARRLIMITNVEFKVFSKGKKENEISILKNCINILCKINTAKMHTLSKQVFTGYVYFFLTFREKIKPHSLDPSFKGLQNKKKNWATVTQEKCTLVKIINVKTTCCNQGCKRCITVLH